MLAALLALPTLGAAQIPKARPQAKLILTVDRPTVARGEEPGYRLTVRNLGRTPLRLIEAQDGSEVGWRNPSTTWHLPDLVTRRGIGRCGNVNPIEARAFFTVAPGASRELPTHWMGAPPLEPGVNRVSLTYDISASRGDVGFSDEALAPAPPSAPDLVATLYRGLTPIHLTSNAVRVTLRVAP